MESKHLERCTFSGRTLGGGLALAEVVSEELRMRDWVEVHEGMGLQQERGTKEPTSSPESAPDPAHGGFVDR